MLRWVERIEKGVAWALIAMMCVVTVLATIELGYVLFNEVMSPPIGLLDLTEMLELFGLFLMVLIAMELLHSIKLYVTERHLDVEVVMLVALMAIARKVIILDLHKTEAVVMYAIAALVVALASGLWLLRRSKRRGDDGAR